MDSKHTWCFMQNLTNYTKYTKKRNKDMVVVKGSNLLQQKTKHFLNKLKDCPLHEGPTCTNGPKFMHYTALAMYYYHLHLYYIYQKKIKI